MPTLEPVGLDEFERLAPDLERLVDVTPAIDRWCSSPDWSISANLAFAPSSRRYLVGDPGAGVALVAAYEHDEGTTFSGLEPMWGFGSPILGRDPVAVSRLLVGALARDDSWQSLVLPGLPLSAPVLTGMAESLSTLGEVRVGTAIEREVIDLTGGINAWLARRSPRFRRNLRKAERVAHEVGIRYEDVANEPDVFDRILAIEARSWKGREQSGITAPDMTTMYRSLTDRLATKGTLRVTVATRDGADVGFILGGIRGSIYRGLQLAYVDDEAVRSIGHLLQWQELHALARLGTVSWYDLGMSIEYKARWADHRVPSPLLIVTNGR